MQAYYFLLNFSNMSLNRVELLKNFLSEDPNDPFNHYALAIELLKTAPSESHKIFLKLLHDFPDYLATYYHAAALFIMFDENDLAEKTYLAGIELAQKTGKEKTLKELKGAYQLFLEELDL
jgi:hypothetical protein